MKTIAKNLLSSLLLMFVVFSTLAQPGPDGGHRVNDTVRINAELEKLTPAVGLTAEQQVQIKEIMFQYAAKRKTIREQNPDREAAREAMKANMEKMNEEISALLTADQKPKYDEFVKQQKEERRRERDKRQGGQGW